MQQPPINRKTPSGAWYIIGITPDYTAWQSGSFCALSSVAYLHDEHQPPHWEWVISFSRMGRARLNDAEVKQCLRDFDALEFEEDNHEPGIARKFWLAADPQFRKPCPCKDETVIVEGDYRYSVKNT